MLLVTIFPGWLKSANIFQLLHDLAWVLFLPSLNNRFLKSVLTQVLTQVLRVLLA